MRKEAIDAILTVIEQSSESEIEELANGYEKLNDRGQYQPFCQAVIYVLRKYYL